MFQPVTNKPTLFIVQHLKPNRCMILQSEEAAGRRLTQENTETLGCMKDSPPQRLNGEKILIEQGYSTAGLGAKSGP